MARELAHLGTTDFEFTRSADTYLVEFKANWSIEQQLILVVPADAGPFRTTSPLSKEELDHICEMHCCWYDAIELGSACRRSQSTLVKILEGERLLVAYPNKAFGYSWKDLLYAWDDECPPSTGLSETLVGMLQEAGVLERSEKQLMVADGYSYLPVTALSRGEVENLYSIFCEGGAWEQGKQLALALGDQANAARWLRREDIHQDPSDFFRILETTDGLSMDLLYQRELARAHWAWNLVEGYSKIVVQWAEAAKLRVADYYARETTICPNALWHPDLRMGNPIVHALGAIGDMRHLASLANDNNQLAAALLADMHRVSMRGSHYPLDAADHWAALQDGYWPTELEIHDAISNCIIYDHQYAKKMEHLGLTYRQLRHKNGSSWLHISVVS